MKSRFSTKNKTNVAILIFAMCGVVLLSNYRMHKLSDQVEESIESIYNDRLLVQDLLFSYQGLLDSIQTNPSNESYLKSANDLRRNYLKTALTIKEEKLIQQFTLNLETQIKAIGRESVVKIPELKTMLFELEKIQIQEAQKQMKEIKRSRSSEELGYYMETTILILFLVLAQLLINTDNLKARVKLKPHRLN